MKRVTEYRYRKGPGRKHYVDVFFEDGYEEFYAYKTKREALAKIERMYLIDLKRSK